MSCTTILVGKKASYDGSTMMARNDDGFFDVKKMIVVKPNQQPKKYRSVISHLEIELPDNPLAYTSCPSVDKRSGVWAACGINSANVSMTATETLTTNALVLGCDPYVNYQKDKKQAGGLGEEDLVVVTLPYIHSAKEGVLRLGSLLEKYGTYEPNGIGFADANEIWWLETIGGHNWISRRVKDDEYVVMPNQFGIDYFDFADALNEKKEFMCSTNLKQLVDKYHLDVNNDGNFNPRNVFGSHTDSDHVYNTPRAWFMERYFNPRTFIWDGENADYRPEDDDIPWSLVPERKITIEDVKYVLSSYFQGTPYNPYSNQDSKEKGIYRSIGINRTGVMAISQIRDYVPKEIAAIQWICFGPNNYNVVIPMYTNTLSMPDYISKVSLEVSTNNFYWTSRIIAALSDPHYGSTIQLIERYQNTVAGESHRIINEYDEKMMSNQNYELIDQANQEICQMAKKNANQALNKVLHQASLKMKNGYNRADN